MWLLPSRSRPHNLERLIAACRATGMTTPMLIMIDDDDPLLDAYRALDWPADWTIATGKRVPLGELYNRAFAAHPQLGYYGFLGDDVVPETPGWDRALIKMAGQDGMAVPAGGETTGGTPHFVVGGDLVRSIGWLALPGLDRLYIDTVWADIARAGGVLRHLPEVMLRHHHFSNRLALFDKTYRKPAKARDRAGYDAWRSEFISSGIDVESSCGARRRDV